MCPNEQTRSTPAVLRSQDLNLLPIFDALINEENLTKAAESLGMSQPAVSNALNRLRLSLKDELFVRTGRGLRPTQRAIELHQLFSPALELIDKGFDRQPFVPELFDRTIDISMDAVVEYVTMSELAHKVRTAAPNLKIQIHPDYIDDVPGRLKDGRLHYALEYTQLSSQHFDFLTLSTDTLSVICCHDHPVIKNDISLEQYRSLPHISIAPRIIPGTSKPSSDNTPIEFVIGPDAPSRKILVRVSSFFSICPVVSNTDLIAIVPSRLAQPFAEQGTIRMLDVPFEHPRVEYRLYWHKSRSQDPSHIWFKSIILGLAGEFSA